MLSVARPVDVDADGMHREAIEDSCRQGGIAEEAPPFAQEDVGGDGGGSVAMPAVDEIVESVGGGRLVAAFFDLAKTDVIDDEERGAVGLLTPS